MKSLVHDLSVGREDRPRPVRSSRILRSTSLILLSLILLAAHVQAAVFQVNDTSDLGDLAPGDGACWTGGLIVGPLGVLLRACTLRSAIEEANALAGRDEVRFESSLIYNANGVAELQPASDYPSITDPIEIDGTTAPSHDLDLTPRVVLLNNGASDGLTVALGGGQSTIRGLTLLGFDRGIYVAGPNGVWIDACALGMRSLGPVFAGVNGNAIGIVVAPNSSDTWIGARVQNDDFVGTGNTISGNGTGILNLGLNTRIIGNKIGTDPTGTKKEARLLPGLPLVSLGNTGDGIVAQVGGGLEIGRVIETGSAPNPTRIAMGNLVSNNGDDGIDLYELLVFGASGFQIVANQIGTDTTGDVDFGNAGSGIVVNRLMSDLQIGGDVPEAANRIAGNGGDGIEVAFMVLAGALVVEGNEIGLARDGVSALPNDLEGIRLDGGNPARIAGNTIGHSPNNGILIGAGAIQTVGTTVVESNFVGVTADGDAIGNVLAGIRVEEGDVTLRSNTIGENNVGIRLAATSADVGVFSNSVGTDFLGRDLGNTEAGIISESTSGGHQIGGVHQGNVVGWNGLAGISLEQSTNQNRVVANSIGVHPSGLPIPNGTHGIRVRASGVAGPPILIGSEMGTPTSDFELRANRIVYNLADAISIQDGTNVVARGNRIAENGQIAIDLNENGLTPNDANDPDVGANDLQNSPELGANTRIDFTTGELQVEYRVDSTPANTAYPLAIDFYLADATGLQPLTYLGSDTYPAAIARAARRVTIVPATPLPGGEQRIVALATTAIDQTSEVSAPVVVPEPAAATGLFASVLSLFGLASHGGRMRLRMPAR